MNRSITFQQYRTIDLSILAVMLVFFQAVIHIAASFWFPDQLYVVSPAAAVVALVMMRWGAWGLIHALLAGIAFTAISGGQWQHYVIYGVGNLLCAAALLMLRHPGKDRVRSDAMLSLGFGLCVQLAMLLGRAAVAAALGYGAGECIGFITTDSLSILFTLVIVWIIRRIEGLFEDQKNYLLRLENERQVEGRDQF